MTLLQFKYNSCKVFQQVQQPLRYRGTRLTCHSGKNCYDVLGVASDASDDTIKKAFRGMALKLHPDVNKETGAQERFMKVKAAYETLADPRARAEHDQRLQQRTAPRRAAGPSSGFGGDEIFEVVMDMDEEMWFWDSEGNGTSSSSRSSSRSSSTGSRAYDFAREAADAGYRHRARGSSTSTSTNGRGSARGAGRRAAQMGGAVSPFEMLLEEMDEDWKEQLSRQLLELRPTDRNAMLLELEQADNIQEVMEILDLLSPEQDDEINMMDVLEAMMVDGGMWHKNSGRGGSASVRGLSAEDFADLFEGDDMFAGYRQPSGTSSGRGRGKRPSGNRDSHAASGSRTSSSTTTRRKARPDPDAVFDIDIGDISMMGERELHQFVSSLLMEEGGIEDAPAGRPAGKRKGKRRG